MLLTLIKMAAESRGPGITSVLYTLAFVIDLILADTVVNDVTEVKNRQGSHTEELVCSGKCLWTQFCETLIDYENNTARVACKPCHEICDQNQTFSSQRCQDKCPGVWDYFYNGSVPNDTTLAEIRSAPTWTRVRSLPPWNIPARFISGIIAAAASILVVLGIKFGTEFLEPKLAVKQKEDEEYIMEDHSSGIILSDERIDYLSKQSSSPVLTISGHQPSGHVSRGSSSTPSEDTHLTPAVVPPYGTARVEGKEPTAPGHM